jgi:predicted transcriptional regulator
MIDSELTSDPGEAPALRRLRSRRSPLELNMDILTVVRDGAHGPTEIMFKANLSWKLVTQHLKELVDSGILSEQSVKDRVFYSLTDKGIGILKTYMHVADQFTVVDRYGTPPEQ